MRGPGHRFGASLISKLGEPEGLPSSNRPLCLLSDVGKILETLLVNRMERFMVGSGIGLSDRQFGFRKNRCTDDAFRVLHGNAVNARDARGYAVAVSLDIRNAFNSVPWEVIHEALERMGFPPYI